MSFIHFLDLVFCILLPIGFMTYAIRYAWNDINEED